MCQTAPNTDTTTIHPRIQLSASLSPRTLSLSRASPTSTPLTLTLKPRLLDSPLPLTLQLPSSALDSNTHTFWRSYYDLTHQTTGQKMRQKMVHGLLGPRTRILDPEVELLTLYPGADGGGVGKEDVEIEIKVPIGVHASQRYEEKRKQQGQGVGGGKALNADTRPYLAVAATQLSELEAGARYVVGLKRDITGEFPGYVWWWDFGEREEVVRRWGGGEEGGMKGFQVPVMDGFDGGARRIRVEMLGEGGGEGELVLEVVE